MDAIINDNKNAFSTAAQIKLGKTVITTTKKLVSKHVPMYAVGYLQLPIVDFAMANLIAFGIDKFGDRCSRVSPATLCSLRENVLVAGHAAILDSIDVDALVQTVLDAVDGLIGGGDAPTKALADMNKAELIAYAKDNGITVAGNASKEVIIAAINAAKA